MRKNTSEIGLEINKIFKSRSDGSVGGKSVSPTRYSSRTSASSSGKKNNRYSRGALDSESKVKVRKIERSRTPLRSKSSNLFSREELKEAVNVTPKLEL